MRPADKGTPVPRGTLSYLPSGPGGEESRARSPNWREVSRALLVVADDATGALATAALLADCGLAAHVRLGLPPRWPEGLAAVVLSAPARHLPPEAVRATAAAAARWGVDQGAGCLAVRIDSTLRGAPGAAIEGVLEVVPEAAALVVAAVPRSGRATVGGRLLVGGRPLEAADTGSSLPTSHVPTLLRHQVRSPLSWVPLEEVRGDPAALRRALRDRVEAGIRVLVADSASDEDIVRVAAAARGAGGTWVPADPGPLTAAYVAGWGSRPGRARSGGGTAASPGAVLGVVGSVTALTRRQIEVLAGHGAIVADVSEDPNRAAALLRPGATVILRDEGGAGEASVSRLALAARRVLERAPGPVCGLYVSGGDSLHALCTALGAEGLAALGEVAPLMGAGRLVGGTWAGLPVVAKGGLVGPEEAALWAVSALRGGWVCSSA